VPKLALAALVSAVAFAVTACGGGGGNTLSRSQFIAKADALCREANRTPQPAPAQSAQVAAANARKEAQQRAQLKDRLGKLEPPAAVKAQFARYQAQTDQIVALYRQEAAAAQAKDPRRFNQLNNRISTLSAQRAKTGGQIGFKACGGSVSPQSVADPGLVRTVDAACTAANRAVETANPQPSGPTDAAAIVKSGPGIVAAQRRALGVIRAQTPAAPIRTTYGQFTTAFSDRVNVSAQQLTAARRKDVRRLQALFAQDQKIVDQREGPAAQKLGFEVCGVFGENGV
jgi:hypothetical protein